MSFSNVQQLVIEAEITGINLKPNWKVHIIVNHIVPFVKHHNIGLGAFAEQAGEAIHAKFKPTWQRYKVNKEHLQHGERLEKAVVDFNMRRS